MYISPIKKNTETPPNVTVNVPPSPPAQIILREGNLVHGTSKEETNGQ